MVANNDDSKPRKRKPDPMKFEPIPLGYQTNSSSMGFHRQSMNSPPGLDMVLHAGDEHILACAPTGRGKGVSLLIPTLLTYSGSAIVIDVKGENYLVTAERRRKMGQKVYVIDPFKVVTDQPDTFNPLDLAQLKGSQTDVDAETLAEMLATGKTSNDSFWLDTAVPLVAGCIAHALTTGDPGTQNLLHVQSLLRADDVDTIVALLLDQKKVKSKFAREEFAAYLQICSDRTRPCVLSTARTLVRALSTELIQNSLAKSSFNWKDLLAGEPMTIYFVLPPSRLESHHALLRLWIGTLMLAFSYRDKQTSPRTLFLLDEAAHLGQLNVLKQFFTLMRGYGVKVMAFYQDLSQLQEIFENDWKTIVNNAGILATFGFANYEMANDWSKYFNLDPSELMRMPRTDMAVWTPDEGARILRRLNYLQDPRFQGLYNPNPRFSR
jgi:type IV secretion system protein VirD4